MDVFPAGSRPTQPGNSDYFTGTVWQDPIVSAPAPARLSAIRVTFEPGARTAWHHHPFGQTLHVVSGAGLFCTRGGTPFAIRPGDTIWIPPGEEHWHGAGPETGMVHIAMQEKDGDVTATWLDKVTDAEYALPPSS